MSLLKSEPAAPVQSLDELLAIAHALERDSAERYVEFAGIARREGIAELAPLFEQLADEERHHQHSVEIWSERLRARKPDPALVRWEIPETFDLQGGAELASSRLSTAYRVLAIAVRNEDRAFALWSYIAAHAEADEIREAAETMAHQELQHAWMLRRARRKAYHEQDRSPQRVVDDAMLAATGAAESRLAAQLEQAAGESEGTTAEQLRELAAESRQMVGQLQPQRSSPTEAGHEARDILTAAEALVEDYLEISDRSGDEATVSAAQMLAQRAVLRLTRLRAMGGAVLSDPTQPGRQ